MVFIAVLSRDFGTQARRVERTRSSDIGRKSSSRGVPAGFPGSIYQNFTLRVYVESKLESFRLSSRNNGTCFGRRQLEAKPICQFRALPGYCFVGPMAFVML